MFVILFATKVDCRATSNVILMLCKHEMIVFWHSMTANSISLLLLLKALFFHLLIKEIIFTLKKGTIFVQIFTNKCIIFLIKILLI